MVGSTFGGKLTHYVKPVYPKDAKRLHREGTVRLRGLLTKTGVPRNLQVTSGDPMLVPAALAAVRQWRYEPTRLNGEPVEVITQIDVDFNLRQ
jgi:protein TonB